MKIIILKGQPLSTQSIYGHVCRGRFSVMYMTKKGKDLKEHYQLQAKQQCKEMIEGDVEVDLFHKIGEDVERIHAEKGITIWRKGTPKFKKEIAEWKRKFKGNKKVEEQIKRLCKE